MIEIITRLLSHQQIENFDSGQMMLLNVCKIRELSKLHKELLEALKREIYLNEIK
jgi:hypothetical protein